MAKKILVVDDHQPIAILLVGFLKRSGFDTCTACDGREALEVFQREQPDLLITDVAMPHMDGLELSRQVRAISNIPIIIMTGGSGRHLKAAFDAGADSYLLKPFDLVELKTQINLLLANAEPS